MKLIVDGNEYDLVEALQQASLGDLLQLKVKTKTPDFHGVTIKFIRAEFQKMGDRYNALPKDASPEESTDLFLEFLGEEDFLNAMMGTIWLSRRNAGESIDFDAVRATRYSEFNFEPDEDDVAAAEAPKESEAADADQAP